MLYLQLFTGFFKVGLFSFGGGYAALPLIQEEVLKNGWLTLTEFANLITISQMTPGPIAINAATFVGTQTAGFLGGAVATFGCILPSCIIVSILTWVYTRYNNLYVIKGVMAVLRPAVVAFVLSAGISILLITLWGPEGWAVTGFMPDLIALCLFAACLFLLIKYKIKPVYIVLASGVLGGLLYMLFPS